MNSTEPFNSSNVQSLSDSDLLAAYGEGCAQSSLMSDADMDTAAIEAQIDALMNEAIKRGIL